MLAHYSYHIWFKVCRPFRRTYKLSTNCLLVLNGSYCYYMSINKSFTRNQLLKFVGYYNAKSIQIYLTVLISKGYIIESYMKGNIKYYTLSGVSLTVMKELNDSFNNSLYSFCSKYSIEL